MSFITKRERVFNEYDLYDIPARNEGKLKAYSSCTDARAWSHFCSDKSEHLVEIIKRNNDTCRPKYVPTEAIVNTLMVGKTKEIARLKRKIEEFEQMIAAYDDLDLTCDQKCEIAKAHAAIKAANKDLDDLFLDLDLSGFTEGGDSEAFETGKSRGDETCCRSKGDKDDEWNFEKQPTQKDTSNQAGLTFPCDCSTSATDPRIEEMQNTIITKDAKLNAMQNTIAVMENDVCEPYCIYAHIYTALEKIFGILRQNEKYKLYLDLMTTGKDTRCIDIKGKILFKLKVLEKFSLALIAPCSQDLCNSSQGHDFACYRADITPRVETTYALTSAESKQPCLDNKRAQLVADIMENEDMKEILSKENTSLRHDLDIDGFGIENYNIDSENLKRLKNLQENYDDLMTCYEAVKHEKDCLLVKCRKYEELEKEFEILKDQLREYRLLWDEKEHYRRRSADLDTLKEQYLVLSDETSNFEIQLKAETEINNVKSKTIDDLRRENILLEQKLNEASMLFEKEKNALDCKLKESDCKSMCQDQQIKSLSLQIDRLLEQDHEKIHGTKDTVPASMALRDEINSLNEQITNLKDLCCCNDEEKQQLQDDFQSNLKIINDLKMQIEYWKSNYEKISGQNEYLEKYAQDCRDEVQTLRENNGSLTLEIEEKSIALKELITSINQKSQEETKLMHDMEKLNKENNDLRKEIITLQETYYKSFTALDSEKTQVIKSLQLAKRESQELLEKVRDYDNIVQKQDNLATSFQSQNEKYNHLKSVLQETQEKNKSLQMDVCSRDSNNSILLQQMQKLLIENQLAAASVSSLQDEKNKYKLSVEHTKKESIILQEKINKFEDLSDQLQKLRDSHERLVADKKRLQNDLDDALHSIQLKRQESEELMKKLQGSEQLNEDYTRICIEKQSLQNELINKRDDYNKLFQSFNDLKTQNEQMSLKVEVLNREILGLNRSYDNLAAEKSMLQSDYENNNSKLNHLYNTLESKIDENRELLQRLANVENDNKVVTCNVNTLRQENMSSKTNFEILKRESNELREKVKNYEALESEYDKLKKDHDQILAQKNKLENELDHQVTDKRRIERENHDLSSQSQNLLSLSEDLEKALINARTELIVKSSFPDNPHAEIIKEIEELKQEKFKQQKKIRDLLDKLDNSENIISHLSEDISARDDRIAILDNHINALEDEVRKLHNSLAEVVDTGEQITDHSSQKINQSQLTMEAHHSRATHNMKMEIAKLQSVNTMLEERLSATKIRNDESVRDKHKYLSQLSHLQNEREIIVTDIKQLEMRSVGDSALSPEKCDVEDILGSLDRIRRSLDARSSKSNSLEQTLLSVQNSYQLVQSKTDEAKKIVEKEKQKIVSEKEEAIKDKINMEKQLNDLKKQLEQQISHDKKVIKDLEGEILNQKLIIDKVNQSTQNYISKLEGDMQSLQLLYQNSLGSLEDKLKTLSEENTQYMGIIEKTKIDLEEKIKEVEILNKALSELKKEPGQNISIQTSEIPTNRNMGSQTDNRIKYEDSETSQLKEKYDKLGDNLNISAVQVNKSNRERKSVPNDTNGPINSVQVLTANVDHTFDFFKSSYLNHKLKQLSPGRLEHYSISCASERMDTKNEGQSTFNEETSQAISDPEISTKVDPKYRNTKVIDIYNTKSMHTNSSKAIYNDDTENEADVNIGTNQIKSPTKSSAFTGFGLTNESFATGSNINNDYENSNMFASASEVSTDKDLFVIYRDSESNPDKLIENKGPWNANRNSELVVEAVTIQQNQNDQTHIKEQRHNSNNSKKQEIHDDLFVNAEQEDYEEDDSVKHKLKISLPRVGNYSPSIDASDADKKSLDSYTIDNYPPPKDYSSSEYTDSRIKLQERKYRAPSTHSVVNDKDQYSDATNIKKEKLQNVINKKGIRKVEQSKFIDPIQQNLNESESRHKLSRVGADVLLLKSDHDRTDHIDSYRSRKSRDLGLKYIIDSHKDPDNIKTYKAAKALRKTRSDERFNLAKQDEKNDSSPSRLSELKKSSTDYKTISSNSYSKSSDKSQPKSYTEQCVMVKLDSVEEYEKKIQNLTKTLENIEKDYKNKIDAIKMQYDNNIKSILIEHNQGVESIQNLHEEALQDIKHIHDNEVENLRTMSIEAMRKADKLEKENKSLKNKMLDSTSCLDEEPTKISSSELKRRKKSRIDPKSLTKTTVEAFNVRPKTHGPCTCSLDINISDTIRNIFEQVDVEQRKMAEYTYLKYIANKITSGNVDALDTQELSFLHLKVCRIWKTKLAKEETLQKRIDSLEAELMNKQKNAQQNIAELDRKVAEERRRLQEVREAVCRNSHALAEVGYVPPVPPPTAEKEFHGCICETHNDLGERRSAGDLAAQPSGLRQKRPRNESNRAVLAKLDVEERREREKKIFTDELPTRLRKSHDRPMRPNKK